MFQHFASIACLALQEARSQMLEFCQSDTDLLELDPFASIHHINDVIRRCHDEDEGVADPSHSREQESIEDTIFHSAPEVSIFGKNPAILLLHNTVLLVS